jgi:hypothetical protein
MPQILRPPQPDEADGYLMIASYGGGPQDHRTEEFSAIKYEPQGSCDRIPPWCGDANVSNATATNRSAFWCSNRSRAIVFVEWHRVAALLHVYIHDIAQKHGRYTVSRVTSGRRLGSTEFSRRRWSQKLPYLSEVLTAKGSCAFRAALRSLVRIQVTCLSCGLLILGGSRADECTRIAGKFAVTERSSVRS